MTNYKVRPQMLYSIGMRVGIIAQEMSLWDRDAPSSGYTQHCQDVVPTILKWLIAWEDTSERGGHTVAREGPTESLAQRR